MHVMSGKAERKKREEGEERARAQFCVWLWPRMLTPATSQEDYYLELQICHAGCLAGRESPAFDGYQGIYGRADQFARGTEENGSTR